MYCFSNKLLNFCAFLPLATLAKYDVLGVEMEAAGMYPIAAEHGVEALALCTVSDDIRTGEALSAEERATTFDEMILVALETARMSD